MSKQSDILEAVKTCIAIETSSGEFDGNRLAKNIFVVQDKLGVVIKVDMPTDNSIEIMDGKVQIIGKKEIVAIEPLIGDR